jgi:hypothetical protein
MFVHLVHNVEKKHALIRINHNGRATSTALSEEMGLGAIWRHRPFQAAS